MLLSIRHETSYAYDAGAAQISQILRLTPRSGGGQEVLDWRVSRSDGAPIATYVDGLGNICGFSGRSGPAQGVVISVAGRVRTQACDGVVRGALEPLPPAYFLRRTLLTGPSEAIRALVCETMKGETGARALADLASTVRERMSWIPGAPYSDISADAALDAARGSAKDLAHVLIAAARLAGAPARFVSGYVWRGPEANGETFAAHAWAEAFVPDAGWVGLDPATVGWSAATHVRVAVGLDHRQAAPISGLWRGEGAERMSVGGAVEALEASQ
jgi:transglutaminase-like putative cysteine protease